MDVQKIELERQRLQEHIDDVNRDWHGLWAELDRYARRNAATVEILPDRPTVTSEQLNHGYLLLSDEKESIALYDLIRRLRESNAEIIAENIPAVSEVAGALTEELARLNREIEISNRARIAAFAAKQLKDSDIASLRRRIISLTEDLQKNQDVQKLYRYSGTISSLTPERCPTCEQSLVDVLLSQQLIEAVMPIEDNIEYIRSQLRMFNDILERESDQLKKLEVEAARSDQGLRELYSQARSVRADLVAPSGNPSAVAIEKKVRTEARIRQLEEMQVIFDETRDRMLSLSEKFASLLAARDLLPKERLSSSDARKLSALTTLLQQLTRDFGFLTFNAEELTIDDDTYRPQKEGYEIGFETSASDAIRLKWAYQLALLKLSDQEAMNHPGMLLFDEPRQQSSSKVSFVRLLERAASSQRHDRQVIVSTSEDLDTIKEFLSRTVCCSTIFPGYVITCI